MDYNNILVMNIRKIINSQGLKQNAVASRAGFNQKDFSNMLNGRKIIKAEYIPLISIALGVDPNKLFECPQKTA